MRSLSFESTMEKLGRILSAQYGVNVIFEGEQAMTDGERIILPSFANPSPELVADMNGFLDHEVGHVKFTEFNEIAECKTRMHKELLNAVEDVRIEREMIREFPGTQAHLDPLNAKYRGKMMEPETWAKIPYPIRVIQGIRDIMEGRTPIIDSDTEKYIEISREAAVELNECKTTKELRIKTGEIIKRIIEEKEEERKKEPKSSEGKGKGEAAPESGKPSDKKSDEKSEGEDSMLTAEDDKRFDEHTHDVHSMMEEAIKKEIKKGTPKGKPRGYRDVASPEWKNQPSLPFTTRFDKVIDHSGKGNPVAYSKMKSEIKSMVAPIRSALERLLKVRENAKWRLERERGSLDRKTLSRMLVDKNYRTIFKEFTKTETKNVAVELLIDLSGSMSGAKVQVAREAATAMGEALKDLQIPFEVTGFSSVMCREMMDHSRGKELSRFNRTYEALKLEIFKSFDCVTMNGITKLQSSQQNPDGECVVWAAKRLAMRREKRKILIVFSDGEPATGDGNRGILCSDLKNKVAKIQKSGIECIGIGIATDSVKHFYPDYLVLSKIEDLPKSAMRKLSSLILRGA